VDRQSGSAQSENKHLLRENRAYAGDEHHDEYMGQNQSDYAQCHSLMNQNHMSDV
jgi:hypothetical protein